MTTITLPRAVVEQALGQVQEFKRRWWLVPAFGNKLNKATREAITSAHSPIFELEHALGAALAQQAEPVAGCETEADCTSQPWCRISGACHRKQAEPFVSDAITRTQTAWKMGYDAAKAEMQQAEPVEPVAEARYDGTLRWLEPHGVGLHRIQGFLYTAPPQRKPLTEEEIREIWVEHGLDDEAVEAFARAVERAHGITGDNTQPTTGMAQIQRLRAERDALADRLREVSNLLTDTTDAHRRKVVMNAWAEARLARHGIPMPEGDPK